MSPSQTKVPPYHNTFSAKMRVWPIFPVFFSYKYFTFRNVFMCIFCN